MSYSFYNKPVPPPDHFNEEKLLEQLEAGIEPLSDIVVALLDGEDIPGDVICKAYMDWAGPASILSYQLRRQGRESEALKQIIEHGPDVDSKLDQYLAAPTPELLNGLAQSWMSARAGSNQLLDELCD